MMRKGIAGGKYTGQGRLNRLDRQLQINKWGDMVQGQ